MPGRKAEARAAISEAFTYARQIGAGAVHVMAGAASGPQAEDTFRANLAWACDRADDLTLLIEPLNPHDAPGYFLNDADQAARIITDLGRPRSGSCSTAVACRSAAAMSGGGSGA